MVEVEVLSLAIDEKNQYPVVILQTLDGSRRLPIWIGPPEASAIAMEVAGKKFQRPLTHDLLLSVLKGLQAKVRRVEICDLKQNTFFAKITIEGQQGQVLSIDARPSDSIALALKAKAKIYAAEELLTDELDRLIQTEGPAKAPEQSDEQRAEELRRFIENLNPKDFGKYTF
ncbi:MAG: bifunctional nuclease family protein [Candidatus Eisenbacteria bacterium]|nr:bifunctional nuclease family protein [Candidatus Eisenbacteria bacterium]